jgi:competence protein ComEC
VKSSKRRLPFYFCILVVILAARVLSGCSVSQSTGNEEEPIQEPDSISLEGKLVVRYMNVITKEEGGDAIIIQTPDRSTLMIDAGRTVVGNQVDQYLDQLDIQTIDYAIATHPHIDHIGGYLTLLDTKQIDRFLMPNVTHTASYYEDLMDKLKKKQIDQAYLEEGDTITLDKLEIQVYSPPEGTEPPNSTTPQAINDLSIVLKITFGGTSFLFTGDINMNREGKLVDSYGDELSVDMLHAPHHGDDTSSSQNFIQAVDPGLVVISQNNADEIDDTYVYQRYESYGSDIYVTGRDGHLTLASDGEQIEVILKNKRTVSGKNTESPVRDSVAALSF